MELIAGFLLQWIIICTAQKPELPPCPQSLQMFPQSLPMHCVMPKATMQLPGGMQVPQFSLMPLQFPPGFSQYMANNSVSPYSSMQYKPGSPIPAGSQMVVPGSPYPMQSSQMILVDSIPSSNIMPMPKLPVVVMPYYSPSRTNRKYKNKESNKKRYHKHHSDDSSGNESDENEDDSKDDWPSLRNLMSDYRGSKSKVRTEHEITPVLSYVTSEGHVIYQKKISDNDAVSWLRAIKNDRNNNPNGLFNADLSEEKESNWNDGRHNQKTEKSLSHKKNIEQVIKRKTKANFKQQRSRKA